jgi:hypothetical protein
MAKTLLDLFLRIEIILSKTGGMGSDNGEVITFALSLKEFAKIR